MAQKVQDTYQQILDDKQKEVEDNHRLIAELREDRDHYKQGYVEFRDKLEKLDTEFRNFRNETEKEREKMKRDIARNGRQLECLRPFLCGREGCAIRVPVTISPQGEIEKTKRPDSQDVSYLDPYNEE
jgi:predicted RNase H-like nuclease (RuvC/YqgF family)